MKSKETLFRVLKLVKPYRLSVIVSLIFGIISVILTLYVPIVTGQAIDLIIGKGNVDFDKLVPVLIKIGLIIACTGFATWLMNLCNNRITYRIVADVRKQAFASLAKQPISYIDSHRHGDIISRIINDVDQFSDGLLLGFTQLFTGVITIIGTLFFMFSVNISISIVVVVITPLSLFVAGFIAKYTYKFFRKQSEIRGEMTSLVNELVGNQKVVKAFNYDERAQNRFDDVNGRLAGYSVKAIFFSSVTNPSTRFVNGLVYAGVGVVGALLGINGAITVGQLSCFLTYANQYTKPFNEISGVVTELQNAFACASRVFELIDEKPESADNEESTFTKADGNIEFRNVSFSYVPEKPLIQNLNLNIEKGKHIAIVGPTGCGKTTLINLIMRFYDTTDGKILLDGTDINSIPRNILRSNIGMVLQETWLKSGTIRENIAYGKPDATDEEIIGAAKSAYAHGFIRRLPDGYNTVIGEDGGSLSQGQKQLLCIARLMLCLPPVLILDEATSSIDTMTEVRIQKAFAKMTDGRTSFIVAHRLSTIKESDLILVMRDGNIVEQGTHKSLLAAGGFYSYLYQSRLSGTAE